MATLHGDGGGSSYLRFTPISSVLNNLPNGAGTIAALYRRNTFTGTDICGLMNSTDSAWYHTLGHIGGSGGNDVVWDDDGLVGINESPTWAGAIDTWYISAVTWPAGGAQAERFHHINQQSPAGWTHSNGNVNNGGNRAGPGTSGRWHIGYFGDGSASASVDIALVAAWVGNQLVDAQIEELSVNNKTSDWWNNSDGHPDLLIECTSLTPTDIGANPSTYDNTPAGITLTGPDPTWIFNGRGVSVVTDDDYSKFPKTMMRGL